jgi:hypothetical protein
VTTPAEILLILLLRRARTWHELAAGLDRVAVLAAAGELAQTRRVRLGPLLVELEPEGEVIAGDK